MGHDREEEMKVKPANWGLTSKGAAALSTGLVALPVLEGVAHMGPLGIVIAGAATLIAFRHGDELQAKGKALLHETVNTPATRSMSDRLMGRKRPAQQVSIGDESILLGFDKQGRPIYRTWKQLKAILILGLQGGGKTTTACHIIRQAVEQGARLAIIDKHAQSEEDSLTQKIMPFEAAFDCSIGVDPASAMRTVQHARRVIDARMEGAPCDYPLLFVIDEFSAIMRQLNDGGKWHDVAVELVKVVEDYNTEGRKHRCYVVCMGQVTNVSRTGGSEIRDLFNTRIIHGMRENQARMVNMNDFVKQIRSLEVGQAMVDVEGKDEPFFIQVPNVSAKDIKATAQKIVQRDPDDELMNMPDLYEDEEDDDDPLPETEVIPIGRDNKTKQEVGIPKQTFDLLVRLRKAGKLSGFREIQEFLDCTETHARNINKLIDEACETGR